MARTISPPLRAALIDLDGTLVDSAPELARAVDRMLVELGHRPIGEEAVRGAVGDGVAALVARGLERAAGAMPDQAECMVARRHFDRAYAALLGRHGPLYPGVIEGLDALRRAGVATACVTNKAATFTEPLLANLGLRPYFDVVVSGDTTPALKPDPEPLLFAARKLGVAIVDCVMIGDSANDVAAARAAGCPAWCVRSGYNRGEAIEASGPDAVFDRFDQLVARLVAILAPERQP